MSAQLGTYREEMQHLEELAARNTQLGRIQAADAYEAQIQHLQEQLDVLHQHSEQHLHSELEHRLEVTVSTYTTQIQCLQQSVTVHEERVTLLESQLEAARMAASDAEAAAARDLEHAKADVQASVEASAAALAQTEQRIVTLQQETDRLAGVEALYEQTEAALQHLRATQPAELLHARAATEAAMRRCEAYQRHTDNLAACVHDYETRIRLLRTMLSDSQLHAAQLQADMEQQQQQEQDQRRKQEQQQLLLSVGETQEVSAAARDKLEQVETAAREREAQLHAALLQARQHLEQADSAFRLQLEEKSRQYGALEQQHSDLAAAVEQLQRLLQQGREEHELEVHSLQVGFEEKLRTTGEQARLQEEELRSAIVAAQTTQMQLQRKLEDERVRLEEALSQLQSQTQLQSESETQTDEQTVEVERLREELLQSQRRSEELRAALSDRDKEALAQAATAAQAASAQAGRLTAAEQTGAVYEAQICQLEEQLAGKDASLQQLQKLIEDATHEGERLQERERQLLMDVDRLQQKREQLKHDLELQQEELLRRLTERDHQHSEAQCSSQQGQHQQQDASQGRDQSGVSSYLDVSAETDEDADGGGFFASFDRKLSTLLEQEQVTPSTDTVHHAPRSSKEQSGQQEQQQLQQQHQQLDGAGAGAVESRRHYPGIESESVHDIVAALHVHMESVRDTNALILHSLQGTFHLNN